MVGDWNRSLKLAQTLKRNWTFPTSTTHFRGVFFLWFHYHFIIIYVRILWAYSSKPISLSFVIAMNILLMSFMQFLHRNSLLHSTHDTNHVKIKCVLSRWRKENPATQNAFLFKLFNQKRFLAFINQITCCNLFYIVFFLLFHSSLRARLIFMCRPQHSFFDRNHFSLSFSRSKWKMTANVILNRCFSNHRVALSRFVD